MYIKLLEKEEFEAIIFDLKYKTFIIHINLLVYFIICIGSDIYLSYKP